MKNYLLFDEFFTKILFICYWLTKLNYVFTIVLFHLTIHFIEIMLFINWSFSDLMYNFDISPAQLLNGLEINKLIYCKELLHKTVYFFEVKKIIWPLVMYYQRNNSGTIMHNTLIWGGYSPPWKSVDRFLFHLMLLQQK